METCSDCLSTATCEYDFGAGKRYGCANHDPLLRPGGVTVSLAGWTYRSLPQFPVLATTGHLGIAGGHLS